MEHGTVEITTADGTVHEMSVASRRSRFGPGSLTPHERDYRKLRGFLKSPEVAGDEELIQLVENSEVALLAAREELRTTTRQHVIEGVVKHRLAEEKKYLEKMLKHAVSGEELGRRRSVLQGIRTLRSMMQAMIELLGHAAMLDPDADADPDQGDLVEFARKAEAEATVADATNTVDADAEAEQGADASSKSLASRNQLQAAAEFEIVKPIINDESNKMAERVWDKKRTEQIDYFEAGEWSDVPESKRLELVAEIVGRFGGDAEKAALEKLIEARIENKLKGMPLSD